MGRARMNDLLQQAYQYTLENTTQVVVAAILLFVVVYYVTGLMWPVAAVAIVAMLVLAYGAGLETIENMDDVDLKK